VAGVNFVIHEENISDYYCSDISFVDRFDLFPGFVDQADA
jgi:hypothetical protein